MSETLLAIKLLREHRDHLHFYENMAREAAKEEGVSPWFADAFRLHTEMAEQILGLLVPGQGEREGD